MRNVQMKMPVLEPGQVHVWTIDPGKEPRERVCRDFLLSADETMRAERIRTPEHRNRFINSRVTLRLLLAGYLECDARSIRFEYGKYGKPRLAEAPELQFNLSHAHNMLTAAFALKREVGIDIVRETPLEDDEGISRMVFSATEQLAFSALPAEERRKTFFRIWARKEAYIKATGGSIALHAASFSVSAHSYEGKGEVIDNDSGKIRLCDLDAPMGFFTSLAAAGSNWRVSAFRNGEWRIPE